MAAAPSALAPSAEEEVSLDLSRIADRLRVISTSSTGKEYEAGTVCASIEMQANELQGVHKHGLDPELMGSQIAELLCSVVRLANLCGVDVAVATEEHLHAEEARRHTPRPTLRGI